MEEGSPEKNRPSKAILNKIEEAAYITPPPELALLETYLGYVQDYNKCEYEIEEIKNTTSEDLAESEEDDIRMTELTDQKNLDAIRMEELQQQLLLPERLQETEIELKIKELRQNLNEKAKREGKLFPVDPTFN